MKFNRIILATAVLLFTLSSLQAQPGWRRGNRGQGWNCPAYRFQERTPGMFLDLSDEQKEQALEIRQEFQKKCLPLRTELNELRAQNKSLTVAEDPDMQAIEKNIESMEELRTGIRKLRAAQTQEFRSILTEEQRLRFDNHRMHRRGMGPYGRSRDGYRFRDGRCWR